MGVPVNSLMPPLTVAVNMLKIMLKITNDLEAFVGYGFRVGLLICGCVFICSRYFKNKILTH